MLDIKNKRGVAAGAASLLMLALLGGCASSSAPRREREPYVTKRDRTWKGAGIGAAAGAAGAVLMGKREADEILAGAAIGAVVGGSVGAYMDAQQEKLARIPGTQVERVDDNTLLVHFDNDVLFDVDSTRVDSDGRQALQGWPGFSTSTRRPRSSSRGTPIRQAARNTTRICRSAGPRRCADIWRAWGSSPARWPPWASARPRRWPATPANQDAGRTVASTSCCGPRRVRCETASVVELPLTPLLPASYPGTRPRHPAPGDTRSTAARRVARLSYASGNGRPPSRHPSAAHPGSGFR